MLGDLNLLLPPDSVVGLVGLNGAGKSTIAKLLCGLYQPTRGCITWDGTDIREIPIVELRTRISAVFQDFMAYELSAHDNIALGSRDPGTGSTAAGFGVSREAITAAASAAGHGRPRARAGVPDCPGASHPGACVSSRAGRR